MLSLLSIRLLAGARVRRFGAQGVTKNGRVELVARDFPGELGFHIPAPISRHVTLGNPLLNCLRSKAHKIAKRGLATGEADGFVNPSFHVLKFNIYSYNLMLLPK